MALKLRTLNSYFSFAVDILAEILCEGSNKGNSFYLSLNYKFFDWIFSVMPPLNYHKN